MNIDLIPNGAIKRVHVSQNDVGRTLTFELFNNSTSYTVPSGAVVKIQGTKPSGFGFSETCTVNGNVATIDTTEAMTDESGNIQTELSISYGDVVIGTSNFVLAVERNPHPSNTTDGTQITAQSLQVQINELAEIIESGGSGLTDEAKQALLNCFAHVAWIDENGQTYYGALEDALYPPATLTSISCVYTQSGTVYDTDSLDDLKADLVVTAHHDNGTTQTVTSYTLSGTLTVGTSTIMVTYGGKTTTFDVTVTDADAVDYTIDALANVTWTDGYTYDTSTGALKQTAGEHCTDKFSVQQCTYIYKDSANASTYLAIFIWDKNGNYVGYSQVGIASGATSEHQRIQLNANYQYAVKAYNNGTFDPSTITMLPVDNTENAVPEFTINLADYVEELVTEGTFAGALIAKLDINSILQSNGIASVSTFADKINRMSMVGIVSNRNTAGINKAAYGINGVLRLSFFVYSNNALMQVGMYGITTLDGLKAYITNNNVSVTFNY